MIGLKRAAIAGLGIVALPGYVCRDEVRSGILRRVLPTSLAGDSTITALIPYRQGPAAVGPRLPGSPGGRVPESGSDIAPHPYRRMRAAKS